MIDVEMHYSVFNRSIKSPFARGLFLLESLRAHPCFIEGNWVKYIGTSSRYIRGDIAQLARAPALQAGGPGFESLLLHHS